MALTFRHRPSRKGRYEKRDMNKFCEIFFIRGANHDMYDSLLLDWHKMYADKHSDLYPEDLTNIADIMRVMPAKKKK